MERAIYAFLLASALSGVVASSSIKRRAFLSQSGQYRVAREEDQAFTVDRKGRVLFGTLTCPHDWVSVDLMLPHQLRQSMSSIPYHSILYIGHGPEESASAQRRISHASMVQRVQSAKMVNEVVHIKDINALPLARKIMDDDTVRAYAMDFEYNKAMVAFLSKCRTGAFDHCAWLDGDMFVHGGPVPWIDEAIRSHLLYTDRNVIASRPQTIGQASEPQDSSGRFTTQAFIYHRAALERALPLKMPHTHEQNSSLFEDVMHQFQNIHSSGHGGSWVAHPPTDSKERLLPQLFDLCGPQVLETMISIAEQGSEDGEMAYKWFGSHSEEMDAKSWFMHTKHALSQRNGGTGKGCSFPAWLQQEAFTK